ncbi:IS1380 family transposase [Leucobacter sp. W1038]|uniref:IS1380 family transposase n=1 Tax=Leucobacter sp. W1038 TaxID=3438281 RepID=UPI003D97BE70
MQFNHTCSALSAAFDDANLVSAAGLVPVMRLAERAGLTHLAAKHLTVPSDKGANAGAKVSSLVAGMVAGADSIEDMRLLRHGGMGRLFDRVYAPSTLGSFLRAFEFGHVRQLDAVASRFLTGLAQRSAKLLPVTDGYTFVDVDDTIIEVEGYLKQGASFGYSGVRGLNAVLATASTSESTPVIVTQRLRKGSTSSARGAKRVVSDALAVLRRMPGARRELVRADAAYYSHAVVSAAQQAGADVSVTVRMNPSIRHAIESISGDAWTPIEYPGSTRDKETGLLISRAEVAEVPYTAFTSKKGQQVSGRLVVRRIPELGPTASREHPTLFDMWRFHAFFTTVTPDELDTVTVDQTHRHHAIIEQINADLKASALAHVPSGKYAANAAWLVLAVIAHNLTRAAAVIADPAEKLGRAVTQTIRRTLINVPARIARSARKLRLHLPECWPWAREWAALLTRSTSPPGITVS